VVVNRLDQLARSVATAGSRRRLLGVLGTVPFIGSLLDILDAEDTEAAGRRKRRKKRHKHGRGRKRKNTGRHKKKCTPESTAQTCAGKCGSVTNTCKQLVNCGSCACNPSCGECLVCQEGPNAPGVCVADPAQQEDACGEPGQFCQSDGVCACDATSCPACTTCTPAGICEDCTGCCDGGTCVTRCGNCHSCNEGQCEPCQDGCGDGACCYATTETFQAALADPAGPETIRLCAGTFSLAHPNQRFAFSRPVTVIGAGDGPGGTVLTQIGFGTVIYVESGSAVTPVHLEGIAITGGRIGVEASPAAHLTMTDCTVHNNRSSDTSRGVFNAGTVTLTSCQLRDNGPATGSFDSYGGGLHNNGVATVISSCITGNRQELGGGIFNNGSSTLTLTDTRVFGNAAGRGGGLDNDGAESNVTIQGDTVICDNTATGSGPNCNGLTNAACGASPCPGSCSSS
jgi:hypothetical protein